MLKRVIVVALFMFAVNALFGPTQAQAEPPLGRWRGPCSTWEYGENLQPSDFPSAKAARQIDRLVTCLFDRYAPGNSGTALYVMHRESGGYPWAFNTSSGCAGLFQHITWTGRVTMLPRWAFAPGYHPSAFDPRANAWVAALMVRSGGWGPWSM
jgi:hypothetical protein